MTFGTSVQRFYDQRRISARQTRHLEFELRAPQVAGFRGKLGHFRRAVHAGDHGSSAHGLVSCISDGDLQERVFAGEPRLCVDQFERKNPGRRSSTRISGRHGSFLFLWQRESQSAGSKLFSDRVVLLVKTRL